MSIPETREEEWTAFSEIVKSHILQYTIKQYNDKGEDNVTNWTIKDLMEAIYKYYSRYKSNQRPGQEQLDLMKIAHYACMAYWKYEEEPQQELQETTLFSGYPHELGYRYDIGYTLDDVAAQEIGDDDGKYEIILRKK